MPEFIEEKKGKKKCPIFLCWEVHVSYCLSLCSCHIKHRPYKHTLCKFACEMVQYAALQRLFTDAKKTQKNEHQKTKIFKRCQCVMGNRINPGSGSLWIDYTGLYRTILKHLNTFDSVAVPWVPCCRDWLLGATSLLELGKRAAQADARIAGAPQEGHTCRKPVWGSNMISHGLISNISSHLQ